MSETLIPMQGQTSVLDRPADLDGAVDVTPGSANRGKLLVLGGLAAVVVLGVLAYFLVFAGSDEEAGGDVVRPPASSGSVPQSDEEPATQPAKQKKRISAKSFGRDPFKALISEPVTAVGTSTTTGAAAAVPATSTDTAVQPATQPETSTPTASQPHRFKVVDVAPDNSTISVKVDGQFYRNLKAGEVFAKFFKVRFIGGSVNDFQYGEESFKVVGTKAVSIG